MVDGPVATALRWLSSQLTSALTGLTVESAVAPVLVLAPLGIVIGGGSTRTTLTSSGGNYGPAAAHAGSLAPPVLFFFIGAWIYGFPVSSFIVASALILACWGAALYARRLAFKKTPPDNYSAFQYKQAVVFAASTVGITALLGATGILAILTIVIWPIAIGYTL